MPFQDQEDLQHYTPPPRPGKDRWLRRIFVEDWNLKLLALAVTLVLWFAVTGQKRPMTKRIAGVQLSFVHADDLEISNDPPARVDVTLTGSSDKLAEVNPMDLLATVLIGDHATGDRVVRLSRERLKLENLPDGVEIEAVQPSVLSVRLEPRDEKQVRVEVKLEGKVPDGFEVYSVTATPATIKVRGPRSHVNAIEKATTESISLEGHRQSFDLNQVAIDIPDQKIDMASSLVQVHVDIGERRVEKSFSNLPAYHVEGGGTGWRFTSFVVPTGPAQTLEQFRPETTRLLADKVCVGAACRNAGYSDISSK